MLERSHLGFIFLAALSRAEIYRTTGELGAALNVLEPYLQSPRRLVVPCVLADIATTASEIASCQPYCNPDNACPVGSTCVPEVGFGDLGICFSDGA